jgi:diguanylate cyclase (GGDEF)-like protein/PAS domain S-box-containing protein
MTEISDLSLKKLLEHAHIGVVIHQWDTSVVYANPTAMKLMRLTHDQIIGRDAFDPQWCFLDESGEKLLVEDFPVNKVRRNKQRLHNEIMGVVDSSREDISWFMINAYPEYSGAEESSFIVVTFNDISDSKQFFSFQEIVENTQDMVIVTEAGDIDAPIGPKIIYVNKAFERITGYREEDVIGETPRILQGALTDAEATGRIHKALQEGVPVSETLLNYDAKGRPYWIDLSIIPLVNKYGSITHFAAIERDVSEQKFRQEQLEKSNSDLKALKRKLEELVESKTQDLKRAKSKLEKIAFFDHLTNIPNRRFFIDQANKLLNFCQRRETFVAIGLIDIDDFKILNDRYGHDSGDAAFIALSNVLAGLFRADDAYCRYGGEEFAFVIAVTQPDDAQVFADRLLNSVRGISVQVGSENDNAAQVSLTVSVGIKLILPDRDTDLEKELKDADNALYKAKRSGKDGFCLAD